MPRSKIDSGAPHGGAGSGRGGRVTGSRKRGGTLVAARWPSTPSSYVATSGRWNCAPWAVGYCELLVDGSPSCSSRL
eukprot:145646-Pyramimonas_sp.AAC.1